MTRFIIDAGAALALAEERIVDVPPEHELLAPTLLRSQVLSRLHEAAARGELPAKVAEERFASVGRIKVRLLGDAVLRRVAWRVPDQLGSATTYDAEYIALTQLQGDALVTTDPELARAARGIVRVAPLDELRDALQRQREGRP